MNELSEADRFLLQQVRDGDAEGWFQLIQRYQGRLVSFARRHLSNEADADDVVQETFVNFLTGLDRFRGDASLETYLFAILRRRIVDHIRKRGRTEQVNACSLQDTLPPHQRQHEPARSAELAGPVKTASWYVRQEEEQTQQQQALWTALRTFIDRLKQSLNFRDLEICDLVFHAQIRNKDIAQLMQMDEKQVALLKHRFIKRISRDVQRARPGDSRGEELADETLLTRLWDAKRPSCPKRSTIGKYLLGTLDADWQAYVEFHIGKLGCRFCQANLEDLDLQMQARQAGTTCDRIIQSTIGFLHKA
jgi:RNA polymerase sigma factor (sigma-70 family)